MNYISIPSFIQIGLYLAEIWWNESFWSLIATNKIGKLIGKLIKSEKFKTLFLLIFQPNMVQSAWNLVFLCHFFSPLRFWAYFSDIFVPSLKNFKTVSEIFIRIKNKYRRQNQEVELGKIHKFYQNQRCLTLSTHQIKI